MKVLPKSALWFALAAAAAPVCISVSLEAQSRATVQRVTVLDNPTGVEVEITCSSAVIPQAQTVADPDRLVIDFPEALPAATLHDVQVRRGEIRNIRVGLFAAHPPVTRVVLDLNRPQSYQLVPLGNRIRVRVGSGATAAAVAPAPAPAPRVRVELRDGLLSIDAERATLAEVLSEIKRHTGADVPIPAGAEQELVVVRQGPMPAEDALAALLYGSRFDFILVGSSESPGALRSVILTPKSGLPEGQVISSGATFGSPISAGAISPLPQPPEQEVDEEDGPDQPDPAEQPH